MTMLDTRARAQKHRHARRRRGAHQHTGTYRIITQHPSFAYHYFALRVSAIQASETQERLAVLCTSPYESRALKISSAGALSPTRTTVRGGEWTAGSTNFKLLFSKVRLNEQCV